MSASPAGTGRPACPTCKQELPEPRSPAGTPSQRWPDFPFCSRRCRMVDLGRWIEGRYVIPGPPVGSLDIDELDGS